MLTGYALPRGSDIIEGKQAAIRRCRPGSDMRGNMSVGGKSEPAEITDAIKGIVEIIRPQLEKDGLFFTGLDIIGDKLIEINVFSPGGLFSASQFAGENFFETILDALARKVERCQNAAHHLTNRETAMF